MAAVATTDNVWNRIAHYMRLAAEYDERAKREHDPEIRADILNTVVQFIALADRATAAPADCDSDDEGTGLRRIFHSRSSEPRPPPITRPGAPAPAPRPKHYSPAGSLRILRTRKASIPTPHPERGILSRCPA